MTRDEEIAQRIACSVYGDDRREAGQSLARRIATALSAARAEERVDGLKTVKWHCLDYAREWISFDTADEAFAYQRETGCGMRIVYEPSAIRTDGQADKGDA